MTKQRKTKGDVYQWITERMIAALEAGTVPWRRPWLLMNAPANLISGKTYRGVNLFSLAIAGEKYTSRWWLTAKQARDRGGHVRKGERSSMVVRPLVGEKTKNGQPVLDANGKPQKYFGMRYSNVFNVEQCEGIEYPKPETGKPVDTLEVCENIIGNWTDCPPIGYGGDRAYYSQSDDRIQMPMRDTFEGSERFYSVLFHECIHATGHKSRLNRDLTGHFGTSDYAREELVAEMGAAFLCGVAGIECKTVDNSAAYIANWLQRLKNDHKLVVTAAKQAQAAAESIQGIEAPKYDSEPQDGNESANAMAQTVAA